MHAVLLLFRSLPNVGIQNCGMWGTYNLAKAYTNIQKSIANRCFENWEASNGHTIDTTRLFHGPWHGSVDEHISAQPFKMWNTLRFHPFLQVSLIFQRRKSDANKQDFENKLDLICQAQSTPKTLRTLTKVFCLNEGWVIARTSSKWGKFWLWSSIWHWKSRSITPKTIGILTKVFYTYGPNLVILAWTGVELSRGQTWWRTDWRTDGRSQTTTIPVGQYWHRVKNMKYIFGWLMKAMFVLFSSTLFFTKTLCISISKV